jgi:hypothetical protein
MWQVMSDTVRHYRSLLFDMYSHLTSTVWIVLRQNLLALSHQPQCIWQLKSRSFERSILNCHEFNCNCVLKEGLLACKNFDFLKTHKSGFTMYALYFTSMATGNNRISVIELSSHAFCKTAALISPRRGYPELPDLWQSSLFLYPCDFLV